MEDFKQKSFHCHQGNTNPKTTNAFSEATTYNDAHTPPSVLSSDAAHTAMTGANGDNATANTLTSLADAQDAIPGLLDHLVATHILRSEHFDDPADLARLPAVSRAMCDAVAATGLRFQELGEDAAVALGCLSALERWQRQGRLSRQELFCEAAARSGQLDELKVLRGRLAVGHDDLLGGSKGWTTRCVAVGTRERMPGGRKDVPWGGGRQTPQGSCSGHRRTTARGTRRRARWLRTTGTSRCCSGRAQTTARGIRGCA